MNDYPPHTPVNQMESQPVSGPFAAGMQELARRHGRWVVFGMRETNPHGGRAFDTAVVVNSSGQRVAAYRKTHLYDAFGAAESDRFAAGAHLIAPIASPWGRLGLFVCYELRFPEVAREQVAQGADILIVPSGWVRGPMKEYHWEHLVVTRALAAPSVAGGEVGGRLAGALKLTTCVPLVAPGVAGRVG